LWKAPTKEAREAIAKTILEKQGIKEGDQEYRPKLLRLMRKSMLLRGINDQGE
jgi:hypothetical protein